jgi:hypothetical protein
MDFSTLPFYLDSFSTVCRAKVGNKGSNVLKFLKSNFGAA